MIQMLNFICRCLKDYLKSICENYIYLNYSLNPWYKNVNLVVNHYGEGDGLGWEFRIIVQNICIVENVKMFNKD